jgi:hypothetical protein
MLKGMTANGLLVVVHNLSGSEKNAVDDFLRAKCENGGSVSCDFEERYVHLPSGERMMARLQYPSDPQRQAEYKYLENCLTTYREERPKSLLKQPEFKPFLGLDGGRIIFR